MVGHPSHQRIHLSRLCHEVGPPLDISSDAIRELVEAVPTTFAPLLQRPVPRVTQDDTISQQVMWDIGQMAEECRAFEEDEV
ncbi:MAG: hypothetical protein WCD52_04385, partial [Xanthobacteraceae bacterium]